jgi:hypothetical protein
MGAAGVPDVPTLQGRGGAWARYEADFATHAEQRWSADGADYLNANYYDRAMIYYVWWARTGNATYLTRAHQLALNARAYIEAANYNPQPYLLMLDGVALHALVTGDARSAATVARVADAMGGPLAYWATHLGDTTHVDMDSRTQARVLQAVLNAWLLKVPSPAGHDYAARLRVLAAKVLGSQSPDGAYRWPVGCRTHRPFTTGMVNDALIRYYQTFEREPRIPEAVQRAVDHLWARDWDAASQSFRYISQACAATGELATPAPDLNQLIASGFAFAARTSGDAGYYAKGDAVFAGGVTGIWFSTSKHFNQQYTSGYRYLSLRW